MAENNVKITNPISPIYSALCGNYGLFWQIFSILLAIAFVGIVGAIWNGIQGRHCNPQHAAIDLKDEDKTARWAGCTFRAIMEAWAGEADFSPRSTSPAQPPIVQPPQ
ncbi:MAG: hypothetical protein J7647_32065 [Cyanobacteria bacterium SBLK]|nr:hypothetical protein [Cyanobacteria bacterium SBLK]